MEGMTVRPVCGDSELEKVYRLRYKVYCDEWGFERPEDHPGELETDEFDKYSMHFVAIDSKDAIIGTIRIIRYSEKGFPLEKHCKINKLPAEINRKSMGEISRLAVSKEYRKRVEDRFIYEGIDDYPDLPKVNHEKRRRQEIVLGLYKCLYVESRKLGITHWYAVMAKGLFLLLKRVGILFEAIGPEINYHGSRTPYIGSIKDIESMVAQVNPELFVEFRDELERQT